MTFYDIIPPDMTMAFLFGGASYRGIWFQAGRFRDDTGTSGASNTLVSDRALSKKQGVSVERNVLVDPVIWKSKFRTAKPGHFISPSFPVQHLLSWHL